MQIHNINIDNKYFEPIRENKITLLIFKTKVISNEKPGDYILASKGVYEIKAKIKKTFMKSFSDVTDKEANMAGFLNRDFLKDELVRQFDLEPIFNFEHGTTINDEIFYFIEIESENKTYFVNNNVNLYTKEFDIDDYTTKWRKYYEKI